MLKKGWADEFGKALDESANYVPRPNPPGLWRRRKTQNVDGAKKGAVRSARSKRFDAVVGKVHDDD
jgi:hypothetical protein